MTGASVRGDATLTRLGARIREVADGVGLCGLLGLYEPSALRSDALTRARDVAPPDLRLALDFLCLERAVPLDGACALFAGDVIDGLVTSGLVSVVADLVQMPRLRLVDHHGVLVFVAGRARDSSGYFGPDSVGLGRVVRGLHGCRGIDLGASTGAQGLLLARNGAHVDFVEWDRSLAPVASMNIGLNARSDQANWYFCDAADVEYDSSYDVVVANAPLLPTFGLARLTGDADGGVDGSHVLSRMVDRVPLADRCIAVMSGTFLGGRTAPDPGWLSEWAADQGMYVMMMPTGRADLTDVSDPLAAELFGIIADAARVPIGEVVDTVAHFCSERRADRLWLCIVVATRFHGRGVVDIQGGLASGKPKWWR